MTSIVSGSSTTFGSIVLAYSLICLTCFMNLDYIRDFDAIQVNATPIILSVIGLLNMAAHGVHLPLLGMNVALMADSYFALRYDDNSDEIDYNALEMLFRESWTNQIFKLKGQLQLQIFALSFISTQLALNLLGTMNGDGFSAIILSFYLARLV